MQLCQELKSSTKVHLRGKGSLLFPTKIYWASTARCFLFLTNFPWCLFRIIIHSNFGESWKKSLAGSNYFSRVFGEVFDVALTLLLRRSKRSWSAALRVFSSFYYSSPERDFLLYRSVCFWLIKNSIKKCCLWPSSHDCKLRTKWSWKWFWSFLFS